jgi:dolichol-phosphate mannosyltransferase
MKDEFAVVAPLANEARDFGPFIEALKKAIDEMAGIKVYLVVDDVSKDNTRELCEKLSAQDGRFVTVYAPGNKNVVDAYLAGYGAAYNNGHDFIIEMDAGLSHDPFAIQEFIAAYKKGYECVFGSRFMKGGSMRESTAKRKFISWAGTKLANILLGSRLKDMTSGYQGFSRPVVKEILDYGLLSKAHFYQTEVRYLLRNKKSIEIPITYKAPSASVSSHALTDSLKVLAYYFFQRLRFKSKKIGT